MGDKMTDNEKADVEESLKKMEDAVRSRVVDNIDNIQKEILDKFTPIRTRIYEQSKTEAVHNEATKESTDNFEEVK